MYVPILFRYYATNKILIFTYDRISTASWRNGASRKVGLGLEILGIIGLPWYVLSFWGNLKRPGKAFFLSCPAANAAALTAVSTLGIC